MGSRFVGGSSATNGLFGTILTTARPMDPNQSTHRHCVLKGRLVSLKQDASHLYYNVTWPSKPPAPLSKSPSAVKTETEPCTDEDDVRLLQSYFALSHSLSAMYEQWTASDANFARRAPAFAGIRILNQDAWETLVSFICSSNNNISRICRKSSHPEPRLNTCKCRRYFGPK